MQQSKKSKPVFCDNCRYRCFISSTSEETSHICISKSQAVQTVKSPIDAKVDLDGWEYCFNKNKNNDCSEYQDRYSMNPFRVFYQWITGNTNRLHKNRNIVKLLTKREE